MRTPKIIKARSEGNQFIAIQHTAPRIQFGVDLWVPWNSPFHVLRESFPLEALLRQFRNWCRPNPDFLWGFVVPPDCMRLSAKKAAHRFSQLVPRSKEIRESDRLFRGFLPRKTTPRDLCQATVIVKLP
jgi:hypothetical protein